MFWSMLCVSGFGQLYNGQTAKGVLGLIGSLLVFVSIIPTGFGGACFWLFWYVAFMVDAYSIAAKRQSGRHVGPWEFF
jgi:serine/threonine-protein kinase